MSIKPGPATRLVREPFEAEAKVVVIPTEPHDPSFPCEPTTLNGGLTIREHFAGLAMQGILANGSVENLGWHEIASDAVGFADALIAALNREA